MPGTNNSLLTVLYLYRCGAQSVCASWELVALGAHLEFLGGQIQLLLLCSLGYLIVLRKEKAQILQKFIGINSLSPAWDSSHLTLGEIVLYPI